MTTQLAIKLPDELVVRLDHLVGEGRFASRSEAVRDGIRRVVRDAERARIDEAFVAGFARHPDDALGEATRLAVEAIEDEPWERWW
ncbi:ribbon-helix-helix domain-containing protein [Iamia sp.]|uniref:ribbon-helix-helix domain-containing protein n=1 Tax=Iamia sp. TaxID=2722710 RepID=UPI002CCB6F60|nr:ribbon-helix-helix protein, CopG family [Iamia sp.]HXH58776.1 ribbon-helix-helix protein, CopG family [Iamia sp.]